MNIYDDKQLNITIYLSKIKYQSFNWKRLAAYSYGTEMDDLNMKNGTETLESSFVIKTDSFLTFLVFMAQHFGRFLI